MRVRTQVNLERRTVGECDFVLPQLLCESQAGTIRQQAPATAKQPANSHSLPKADIQWWHIETSVKFFLCVSGLAGSEDAEAGDAAGDTAGCSSVFLGPHRKESMADRSVVLSAFRAFDR